MFLRRKIEPPRSGRARLQGRSRKIRGASSVGGRLSHLEARLAGAVAAGVYCIALLPGH